MGLTLHLHIGMPKTGTSAIQSALSEADFGDVAYLRFGPPNHSMVFGTLFEPNPWNRRPHQLAGRSRAEVRALRDAGLETLRREMAHHAASGRRGVIFSAERLATPIEHGEGGLVALHDFFREWCSDIRAYGYVRDPLSYAAAAFQQRLRGGVDAPRLVETPTYRRRFERFDRVLGRDRVSLRRYAPDRFPGGCVVADIAAEMGIALPPGSAVRANESLPAEVSALLYALRLGGHGETTSKAALEVLRGVTALLARSPGRPLAFGAAFLSRFEREDTAWMEARLGEPLDPGPPRAGSFVARDLGDLLDLAASERGRLAAVAAEMAALGQDPAELDRSLEAGLAAGLAARRAGDLSARSRPAAAADG